MMVKKVYLTTPYSCKREDGSDDWSVMGARYQRVTKVAGILLERGLIVYSPITHCHPIATCHELPRTYNFWLNVDKHFIEWADEVYVFMAPGWDTSKGVSWEIEYGKQLNKPIVYLHEEDFLGEL